MKDSLKNKIDDWLEKNGYPFELFVASRFQRNGYYVTQGRQYLDPDTNQSREVDVTAYLTRQIDDFKLTFYFIVECKSSKAKPWVAFMANDNTIDIAKYSKVSANYLGGYIINELIKRKAHLSNLFINNSNTYAYSLAQALKENDNYDVPFKGIQTISKSTHYFSQIDGRNPKNISIFFPILAIETSLFECNLKVDGSLELRQVEDTKYLLRSTQLNETPLLIDVICRERIEFHVSNYYRLLTEFLERHEFTIREILKTRTV